MPSTAEARTLISNRNSHCEVTTGRIWGSTPQRMLDAHRPPVAATASSGPSSIPSMASVAHLPRVPMECTPMASAPAHGPRPVTGMRIMARISSGTALMTLNSWRTGTRTQAGATLPAARNARGRETRAPMRVPIQAMCTDSKTLPTTPRSAASAKAGGNMRRNMPQASPGAPRSRSMVTSRPVSDQPTRMTSRAPSARRLEAVPVGAGGLPSVPVVGPAAMSDQPPTDGHADLFDDDDDHEHEHQDAQHPVEPEVLALGLDHPAYATGADQAQHHRCADV